MTIFFAAIVFFVSFIVYLTTLCPTVFVGDAGELIAAAYKLGSPHPPGYPLFCIIGKIFSLVIPISSIAYRVNLMSVILSSFTCVFVYFIILKLVKEINIISITSAICASLCLAFSNTFWEQSAYSEVYAINSFFMIACLWTFLKWTDNSSDIKWLYILSLLAGISFNAHHIMIVIGPLLIAFVFVIRPDIIKQRKALLLMFILILAGAFLYSYLVIRALSVPAINWGAPDTFQRFLDHIRRKQYGRLSKEARLLSLFLGQLKFLFKETIGQFNSVVAVFTLFGFWFIFKKDKKIALLFFSLLFMTSIGFTILFNFQLTAGSLMAISEFFSPLYIVISIFIGFGFVKLITLLKQKTIQTIACIGILIFPLNLIKVNKLTNNQSEHFISHDYGMCILNSLPEDSTVFASGDNAMFSLAYLQLVENKRPDIAVFDDSGYIFPNIYGRDFIKNSAQTQDEIRLLAQKQVIKEAKGAVYYTLENTKHDMTGIMMKPIGLLQQVLLKRETSPRDDKKEWKKYFIKGVEKPELVERDYITRNLIAQYFYQSGQFYHDKKMINDSARAFKKSDKIGYDNEWIQSNLGVILMGKEEIDEAIERCKKAIEINPKSAESHLNLGTTYDSKAEQLRARGKIEESQKYAELAMQSYRKAIEIKSTYSTAYFNLGNAYMSQNNFKEAIEQYRKALTYNLKSVEAHINLGNALDNYADQIKDQKYKDYAIYEYLEAIRLNPVSHEAHINLGTAYFNKGMKKDAYEEYKNAIEINPTSVEGHFNLGNLLFVEGRLDESISIYKKVISLNSRYIEAYCNMGLAYEKKGDINSAIGWWQQTLKLAPNHDRASLKLKQYHK